MTKYLLIAIALLTLALGGAGLALRHEIGRTAALGIQLKDSQDALRIVSERAESDRKVSAARATAIALERRKSAQAQAELNAALGRNETWSKANVPTDVQSSILGRSDGPDPGVVDRVPTGMRPGTRKGTQ